MRRIAPPHAIGLANFWPHLFFYPLDIIISLSYTHHMDNGITQSHPDASPTGAALNTRASEGIMRYTKKSVIAAAQSFGSSATTLRGAIRYIIASARPDKPKPFPAWERDASAANDYRYTRRGERICTGLGLPMDYEDRKRALLAADGLAEAHGAPAIPARVIGQLLSRHTWPAATIQKYALDRIGLRSGLRAHLDAAAESAAQSLTADWPLKKSESSWAGGNHTVTVRWVIDPARVSCSGSTVRVWSDNGKWAGTDSHASLTVSVAALQKYPTLRTPDGQIILHYETIPGKPRVAKIVWVAQSRGVGIRPVHGYLIRGCHVEAASLEVAEKRVQKIRREACARMLTSRLQYRQDRREYGSVWVGVADSLAGGNCASGTEQYRQQLCRLVGGEIGGVRADWLLRQRRDTYTLRAVRAALVRSSHPLAQESA